MDGEGNRLYRLAADTSCPCWCEDAHIGRLRPWWHRHTHTRSEGATTPAKTNAAAHGQGAIRSAYARYRIDPCPLPKASTKQRAVKHRVRESVAVMQGLGPA